MKYNPSYYKTEQWLHFRKLKIEWENNKCERCGSSKRLQVHHKNYKSFGDEMPWDLMVLCRECHRKEHYIGFPDSDMIVEVSNAS